MNSESLNEKGAFKHLPKERQPERIPTPLVRNVIKDVDKEFTSVGVCYFIDEEKKARACGKSTIGDLDVLFVPFNTDWRQQITNSQKVSDFVSNGHQLMTVYNAFGEKYMVDFISISHTKLEFNLFYFSYGTTLSACLGSFARSIGYKWTNEGLFKRVKDKKGNWHNIFLTDKVITALNILGLSLPYPNVDDLFTWQGVANFITSSTRFNHKLWSNGNREVTNAVIPLNKNAREAIEKKPETLNAVIQIAFTCKAVEPPLDMWHFERIILSEDKIDEILEDINFIEKIDRAITGHDVIETLKISHGPTIGKILKDVNEKFTENQKEEAIQWLLNNRHLYS